MMLKENIRAADRIQDFFFSISRRKRFVSEQLDQESIYVKKAKVSFLNLLMRVSSMSLIIEHSLFLR